VCRPFCGASFHQVETIQQQKNKNKRYQKMKQNNQRDEREEKKKTIDAGIKEEN
jgi:hypothetical protein